MSVKLKNLSLIHIFIKINDNFSLIVFFSQSKTESAPFSQTYEFNQGKIIINFNDEANKINDIHIIDTNSTSRL